MASCFDVSLTSNHWIHIITLTNISTTRSLISFSLHPSPLAGAGRPSIDTKPAKTWSFETSPSPSLSEAERRVERSSETASGWTVRERVGKAERSDEMARQKRWTAIGGRSVISDQRKKRRRYTSRICYQILRFFECISNSPT